MNKILLIPIIALASCNPKPKMKTCDHAWGKWGEPTTTSDAWNGQVSTQFRSCEECGETKKRSIH